MFEHVDRNVVIVSSLFLLKGLAHRSRGRGRECVMLARWSRSMSRITVGVGLGFHVFESSFVLYLYLIISTIFHFYFYALNEITLFIY